MTEKPIDRVERFLEEMHGHREALANQKLLEGNAEEATHHQIEASTLRRVLNIIERVNEGENPDIETDAYPRISKAIRAAEEEVSNRNDRGYEPGLE